MQTKRLEKTDFFWKNYPKNPICYVRFPLVRNILVV